MESRPSSSSDATRALSSATGFPIHPNAPMFVAQAIITTATVGAMTGATLGVLRSANPYAFSVHMGINGGVVGLTFFGIREYLVSPLLLLERSCLSANQIGKLPAYPAPEEGNDISSIRTSRLLDSSISGGLTGGILSTSMRGLRTAFPAFVTGGLVAAGLQYGVNEIRVIRLRLLARRVGRMDETAGKVDMGVSADTAHVAAGRTGGPNQTPLPTASEDRARELLKEKADQAPSAFESLQHSQTKDTSPNSLPARIMLGLSKFLPVRKLSDDEYLATLEKRRAEVDKRLREIDTEEQALFTSSQSTEASRKL